MEVIIRPTTAQAVELTARLLADTVKAKPACKLGLATGATMEAVYDVLVKMNKAGEVDFSQVTSFNLDEYIGLGPDDVNSYRYYMNHHLFDHINIDKRNTHLPNGLAEDELAEGINYEADIEDAGGIDVQLLGIGNDGHVGFNEPGSSLASGTRVKTLAEQTRIDNARFFDNDINQVPTHCITQGIGTIMKARHLVLLAFGAGKAEAIEETVEGGVSAFCPASALQMHPHATIIVDEEAASRLRHKDYYRYAYTHKPAWQGI